MTRQTTTRIVRHLVLAVGSSLAILGIFYGMTAEDPRFRLSMATAYTSLALLATTLLVGPLNVLRERPNPVSTNLRRDLGIWAGMIGLAHVVVGLQVHLRGSMAQYFVFPEDWERALPLRYDLFGAANWTGLSAGLLLVLLLLLSNDVSLRWLGTKQWKGLQRWIYGVFVLVAFHGVAYQVIEDRAWGWVATFAILALAVVVGQASGYRKVRAE